MPELRFDYTTADWVVFAPLRSLRPRPEAALATAQDALRDAGTKLICPFCPGNERMTPHEIAAYRDATGSYEHWQVRVVPNKFPALRIEETVERTSDGEFFQRMGGCGAHEVIVESPDHDSVLATAPTEQIERVIRMAQARYVDLMRDSRFQSVIIFKNHGEAAGTSLQHPHWQIIATPVVPRMLRLKYIEAVEYQNRTGRNLYRALLDAELSFAKRIVAQNDAFAAFIPFAAHLPFETWILPKLQQASFSHLQPHQVRPLAEMLKEVLLRLYVALDNPAFNLTVDTASRDEEQDSFFQWHIRILPRLSTAAGFEMGSGMSINTVLPEDAAQFLRGGNGHHVL